MSLLLLLKSFLLSDFELRGPRVIPCPIIFPLIGKSAILSYHIEGVYRQGPSESSCWDGLAMKKR